MILEAASAGLRGEVDVEASFSAPRPAEAAVEDADGPGGPAGTRVFEIPVARLPARTAGEQ